MRVHEREGTQERPGKGSKGAQKKVRKEKRHDGRN